MSRQERDDGGRFQEKVPLDDVRALFRRSEPRTATEVAETLGISNRAALNKLDTLHENDEIVRKQVGARAVVWYRDLNPRTAAEALAEMTGRRVDDFEVSADAHTSPALDDLEWERPEST